MQIDAAPAGDAGHKEMLLVRHTGVFVIDNLVVAIEGEAVLDVAADLEDCNRFVCWSDKGEAFSEGPRRVRAVKEMNDTLGGGDGRKAEKGPTP